MTERAYFGVDFKKDEVAIGIVTTAGEAAWFLRCHNLNGLPLSAQLRATVGEIEYAIEEAMTIARSLSATPTLCVVEQPGGRTFPRRLTLTQGIILSVAAEAVATVDVAIPTWRKAVLGNGRADKNDAIAYVSNRYEEYLAQNPPLGHDEAEAVCLATYGMENSIS